jgi:hypothetical protein
MSRALSAGSPRARLVRFEAEDASHEVGDGSKHGLAVHGDTDGLGYDDQDF